MSPKTVLAIKKRNKKEPKRNFRQLFTMQRVIYVIATYLRKSQIKAEKIKYFLQVSSRSIKIN